jgi:hypothetical protein
MVLDLAGVAGLDPDQLYFNIETVGNTSSASIPLAIADAKAEGVIKEPLRVFAPGYGAVGGCAVLRTDPAVIAPEPTTPTVAPGTTSRGVELRRLPQERARSVRLIGGPVLARTTEASWWPPVKPGQRAADPAVCVCTVSALGHRIAPGTP